MMISPKAQIGSNCTIAESARILDDVVIGNNVTIEDNCIVGYANLTRIHDKTYLTPKLMIGDNCLIRSGAVLYNGSSLGAHAQIGHNVVLREGCAIGDYSIIGNSAASEGYLRIGKRTHIHAQCHLTAFMTIGDYVFFGPGVITMNDPAAAHYRPQLVRVVKGPTVGNGARIGANAKLLPGIHIGEEAFIAAGSTVTKDVPRAELWAGSPAKKIADVDPSEFVRHE